MTLTGKCKEDFEKWFNSWFESKVDLWYNDEGDFLDYPPSMQYGVYVDFFDSVGLTLLINTETYDCWWSTILEEDIMSPYFQSCAPIESNSRHEARAKAIEKANEIYNQ